MRSRDITVPTADGSTVLVSVQKHEYSVTVDVDHRQIMFKIKDRPWTISHDVDDLELVAYAALGWLAMQREGSE